MRRLTFLSQIFVLAIVAFTLSSCGLGTMVKKYDQVKFQATPTVLENHGGKVTIAIKGDVPPKYFNKKGVMVLQPVVKYKDGVKELKPITLKGEKVLGDGNVMNKKMGGSFNYTETFEFVPGMTASTIELTPVIYKPKGKEEVKTGMKKADANAKLKSIELGTRKLADGVINTSEKIYHDEDLLMGDKPTITKLIKGTDKDFYEKETIMTNEADIFFVVNQSDLNLKYKLNKDEVNKAALDSLLSFLKKEWKVKSFDINAWASPEGEESLNQGLSDRRSKTADKYIKDFFAKFKKEKAKAQKIKEKAVVMQEIPVNLKANGEDWDSFMKAIAASSIKDKNTIMNVIKSQPDVAKREQEIRNMTVIYKEIEEDILPPLRRSEITVQTYFPKKTDDQIARLSTTYPDSLDQKELLYAASLTSDINTQGKIFKSLTNLFPTDWKGYNDLGYVELTQGNLDGAATSLNKANTLSPNNPVVLMNLGALAAKNKDYAGAKNYYKAAQELGVDVNYNKGILTILDGDYKTAANLMSAKKCNQNVALVELLTGNAAAAASTLQCAPDNAEKFYLLAITSARTSNQSGVFENLKKAVAQNSALKAIAAEDREFLKYFENSEFKAIVK